MTGAAVDEVEVELVVVVVVVGTLSADEVVVSFVLIPHIKLSAYSPSSPTLTKREKTNAGVLLVVVTISVAAVVELVVVVEGPFPELIVT